MQASIPSDAVESVWSDEYRKSWGRKLHMASTAEELLQVSFILNVCVGVFGVCPSITLATKHLCMCYPSQTLDYKDRGEGALFRLIVLLTKYF